MPELKWNNIDGSAMNGALNGVLHATDSFGKSLTNIGDNLYKHTQQLQQNLRDVHDWEKEQNTQALLMKMNGATSQADIDALTAQGLVDPNQLLNQYGTRVDLSKIQQKQHSWLTDTQSRAKSADELKDFSQGSLDAQARIQDAMNNRDYPSAMSLVQEAVASGMLSGTAAKNLYANINKMYESDRQYAIDAQVKQANIENIKADTKTKESNNIAKAIDTWKEQNKDLSELETLTKSLNDPYHLESIETARRDGTNSMAQVDDYIVNLYKDYVNQGKSRAEIKQLMQDKVGDNESLKLFWENISGYDVKNNENAKRATELTRGLIYRLQHDPEYARSLTKEQRAILQAQGIDFADRGDGTVTINMSSNVNGINSSGSITKSTEHIDAQKGLSTSQGQADNQRTVQENIQTPQDNLEDINAKTNTVEAKEESAQSDAIAKYPTLNQETGKAVDKAIGTLNNHNERIENEKNNVKPKDDSDIDTKVDTNIKNNYKFLDPSDPTEQEKVRAYYRALEEQRSANYTTSSKDVEKLKKDLDNHREAKQNEIISGVVSDDATARDKATNALSDSLAQEKKEAEARISKTAQQTNYTGLDSKRNNAIIEHVDKLAEGVDWASASSVQELRSKYTDYVKQESAKLGNDTARKRAFEVTQMRVFDEYIDALNSGNITNAEGKPISDPKFKDFIEYKNRETDKLIKHGADKELEKAFSGRKGILSSFNKEVRNAGVQLAKNGLGEDDVVSVKRDGTNEKVSPDVFVQNMMEMVEAANSGSGGKLVDIYDNVSKKDLKKIQTILSTASAEKKYILAHAIANTLNPHIEKAFKSGDKESTKSGNDEEWASNTQQVADKIKELRVAAEALNDSDIEQVRIAGENYHSTIQDANSDAFSGIGTSMKDIRDATEAHKSLFKKGNDSTLLQALKLSNSPLAQKHLELGSQLQMQTKAEQEKLALIDKSNKTLDFGSGNAYGAGYGYRSSSADFIKAKRELDSVGRVNTEALKKYLNYTNSMILQSEKDGYNISDLKKTKATLEEQIKKAEAHNKTLKQSR